MCSQARGGGGTLTFTPFLLEPLRPKGHPVVIPKLALGPTPSVTIGGEAPWSLGRVLGDGALLVTGP